MLVSCIGSRYLWSALSWFDPITVVHNEEDSGLLLMIFSSWLRIVLDQSRPQSLRHQCWLLLRLWFVLGCVEVLLLNEADLIFKPQIFQEPNGAGGSVVERRTCRGHLSGPALQSLYPCHCVVVFMISCTNQYYKIIIGVKLTIWFV